MQLKSLLLLPVVLFFAVAPAAAQSLSPMRKSGVTPSEIKGYRLTVGNPYRRHMVFELIPMEPGFKQQATAASVNPPELALAPGYARQVILSFKIPEGQKERTIALCVQPKHIDGPVLPRVCGTYVGTHRVTRSGG